jgi:hypothetical protein
VFALRHASRLLVLISQSADPAGALCWPAECRYSENRRFTFALSAPFAATVLFEPL